MNDEVVAGIRAVLADHARLSVDPAGLPVDGDLQEAGMTSHASVNVMLGLEDAFDIEFPDRMLTRGAFESIASIERNVSELLAEEQT